MRKTHITALSVITVASGYAAEKAPAHSSPNILILTVDDLKPELGCYGNSVIKSPNIDAIAEHGTIFLNNQCQQAICAPSRISMFTGMRPDSTKVWDFKTFMRDANPDVLTIPEFFKKHGYETAGRGKLLHGAKNNDPQSWTIPFKDDRRLKYASKYGYPASGDYLAENICKIFDEIKGKKLGWRKSRDYMKTRNARPPYECLDVSDSAYVDGAIADAGIKLLERFKASGKPFFLTLGFHKPHLPFIAPKKYWDLYAPEDIKLAPFRQHAAGSPECAYHTWPELRYYSGIPETAKTLPEATQKKLIHGYYASISYVDAQIGRVVNALKKLGLADNTIIVLWGDHGWHLGDHGLWCKQSNFEQATRAPLIIAAKGFKGGQKTSSPTEFVDIFPTLCDLAGFQKPAQLEGTSLVPIMKDPTVSVKKFAMSQYPRDNNKMGYSLRTKRYRYTQWMNWSKKSGILDKKPLAIELYDYKSDPLEKVNLANNPEYSDQVKRLSAMMNEFLNNEHTLSATEK